MCSSNINEDNDKNRGREQRRNDRQRQRLSALAQISRDQIGTLEPSENVLVPLQEEYRVPRIIDVSTLNDEELDRLRTTDPFMYYSIPSIIRSGSMTSSAQGSAESSDRQLQHLRRSAPAALMSAPFDVAAETTVRRRSRISFELSFDSMMSDIFESIEGGLDAGNNDDESLDDVLDRLSSSVDRPFRRSD